MEDELLNKENNRLCLEKQIWLPICSGFIEKPVDFEDFNLKWCNAKIAIVLVKKNFFPQIVSDNLFRVLFL